MSSPFQSTAPGESKMGPPLPSLQSILARPSRSNDWNSKDFEMAGINSTPVPGAPMLLHTALPSRISPGPEDSPLEPTQSYRPRTRKAKTKEILLAFEDNRNLIALGITPFMPGQDPISNQNRLVRNETIFARHLSNLQKAYSTSESTHAQRMEDMYRILTDHKGSIELLKSASGANIKKDKMLRSDPDFAALVEAHGETRKALDDLVKDIASFSESTKQTIENLTKTTTPPASSHSPIIYPSASTTGTANVRSDPPPIDDTSRKRRRTDSGVSPTSTTSASRTLPIPTKTLPKKETSKEVIYGPITDKGSDSEEDISLKARAIGTDAVSYVGLCSSMIQSIRPAPGRPGHILISFLKADYAARFVNLVSFGLDEHPERVAFFNDQVGEHQTTLT